MGCPGSPTGKWVKGQSGNPKGLGGRPKKGDDAPSAIIAALKRAAPEAKDILADKIAAGVLLGDSAFVKIAAEYRWGKPQASVDVTSGGERLPTPPTTLVFEIATATKG